MTEDHPRTVRQEAQFVKICFQLEPDDRAQGLEAENLWAEPLGEGLYRIESVPFYVYGVSYQDVVDAEWRDDRLVFKGIVRRGGHSTYRILIEDRSGYESGLFQQTWRNLASLGCTYEVAKQRWLAVVTALPLTALTFQTPVTAPGAPGNTGDPERDTLLPDVILAYPNYVEVMNMRLIAGRAFSGSAVRGVEEAVIDTAVAQRFFPQGNAVGARIRVRERDVVVVGIVQQARQYDVHSDGRPQVLIRVSEVFGARPLYYVMRTTRDPASLLPEVETVVHRVDPRVPVGDPRAMEEIVNQSLSPQAIGASLLGTFAIGALLLAAMGLFGVVSGSVTRRHHELAVRLAMGANPAGVLRLVVREGMLLVLMGVLSGAPGILVANRVIRGLLLGVSASDPVTLAGAAGGLLMVTLAACYVPARRALKIEPAQLLRQE